MLQTTNIREASLNMTISPVSSRSTGYGQSRAAGTGSGSKSWNPGPGQAMPDGDPPPLILWGDEDKDDDV